MAQYVFTMNRVGKVVPPKRQILKDISLSFCNFFYRCVKSKGKVVYICNRVRNFPIFV